MSTVNYVACLNHLCFILFVASFVFLWDIISYIIIKIASLFDYFFCFAYCSEMDFSASLMCSTRGKCALNVG